MSYVEAIDAIVVAPSEEEAERIAADLGNGKDPDWPTIDMYNTAWRKPLSYELLELEHGFE